MAPTGLPSHGISIRVITREMITPQDFAFIGDSVGFSITDTETSELPALLDGVFASTVFDSVGGRCTASPNCIGTTGVQAAQAIPNGTEIAIVELGYNDPSGFAGKIDQVMTVLRGKGVTRVGWVTMSERRASSAAVFAAANQALNAARARWPELVVLDWNAGQQRCRPRPLVRRRRPPHLDRAVRVRAVVARPGARAGDGRPRQARRRPLPAGEDPGRRRCAGHRGHGRGVERHRRRPVRAGGSSPCGRAAHRCRPTRRTSTSCHRVPSNRTRCSPSSTRPGEVCVWTYAASHVLVDVNGWFTSGFRGRAPLASSTRVAARARPLGRLPAGQTLRVHVSGIGGVPATGVSAVALNVTAVEPTGWGFFTVWPCGSPMPLDASHVNFIGAGAVEPNSVLVPVDSTGEVCIWTYADVPRAGRHQRLVHVGFRRPCAGSHRRHARAARVHRSAGWAPVRRCACRCRASATCRPAGCRRWR